MDNNHEIHQIKTFKNNWANYCYLVIDKTDPLNRQGFLVDPSWELDKILDRLNHLNVQLTAILLTHSHYDHINLVDPLIDLFNPKVYMSQREIDYYHFDSRNLKGVENLEKLQIGKIEVKCILNPGHTKGSMSYLLSDSLFSGDTIFIEGCGICTEPGGSAEEMFHTFQMLKSIIPPHVRIYPGHSYGKEPGESFELLLRENIYFQIENKDHFVKFRMRKNQKNHLDFCENNCC